MTASFESASPDGIFRAQPIPFGPAWIRAVALKAGAATASGRLVTGKIGRARPALVYTPATPVEDKLGALLLWAEAFDVLALEPGGDTRAAIGAFLAGREVYRVADHAGTDVDIVWPDMLPRGAALAIRDAALFRASGLEDAARALARDPTHTEARARLIAGLADFAPGKLTLARAPLLALLSARPGDVALADPAIRAAYVNADDEGIAAMAEFAARAGTREAALWAAFGIAAAHHSRGDIDAALAAYAGFAGDEALSPVHACTIVHLEIYRSDADDRSIARAKARFAARARASLPREAPVFPAPSAARGAPIRVGFLSAAFHMRPYMSLLLPFLRELPRAGVRFELVSPMAFDETILRPFLPQGIPIAALGTMRPESFVDPAAWDATATAIAVRALDLVVDLEDSLAAYSPGYLLRRPARKQASWFNMTGPGAEPCYDAAIGPASVYPPSLDADFPGRIARLPGDLFVFDPELWRGQGLALPDPGPPPILRNGYATFGSLSHGYKTGAASFDLWTAVLRAVPDARLRLGNLEFGEPHAVARVRSAFAARGIDPARIDCAVHFGWPDYAAGYRDIDVVLATHPVPGGTTIFEAAYLGLPVLALEAPTALGRIGRWLEAATGRPGTNHAHAASLTAEARRLVASPAELAALRARSRGDLAAKCRTDSRRMADAFVEIVERLA